MADILLQLGGECSEITELTVEWTDKNWTSHRALIVFSVDPRILNITVNSKGGEVNLVHARELPAECAES